VVEKFVCPIIFFVAVGAECPIYYWYKED
jgi:hypothetical protein